jgi:hypothetical protein
MQTQSAQILQHLKEHESTTPLEALRLYGVFRLGARCYDLRQAGHTIITDMIEVKGKHGTARVASYRLVQ